MKKWLIAILLLLGLLSLFTYVWIPNTIQLHAATNIKFKRTGLERVLFDNAKWSNWWPKENDQQTANTGNNIFSYNGSDYVIKEKKLSSILIDVTDPKKKISTALNVFFANKDSAILEWSGEISTSYNPFKRFQAYFQSKKLKNDFNKILDNMRVFFSRKENVYGTAIKEILVEDSVLAFTEEKTKGYPSTEFIYNMVGYLKRNIADSSAKEMGFPMLNIFTDDSINYIVKVAIPVDRELNSYLNITFKRMVKRGNILVTEVKGGPWAVEQAFKQVEHYLSDQERLAPAIPFYSLVTDRLQQPDTSQWVTRIYYPVM